MTALAASATTLAPSSHPFAPGDGLTPFASGDGVTPWPTETRSEYVTSIGCTCCGGDRRVPCFGVEAQLAVACGVDKQGNTHQLLMDAYMLGTRDFHER